jgi:hypothetical protein
MTDASCELFVKVDARQILPDKRIADGVNWLQHRVIINSQFNHKDENVRGQTHRFTVLYSKLLQKTLGTYLYGQAIRTAIGAGIIERSSYDKENNKSYGYRIADRYAFSPIQIVEPTHRRLRRRILRERKSEVEHRLRDKTYRALLSWLGKVEISLNDLADIQAEGYARHVAKGGKLTQAEFNDYVHAQLLALRHGHHRFGVDDLGRVHSNVSTLIRPARSRLRIGGQRLVEVDLVNSQVLFLTVLLLKEFKPGLVPSTPNPNSAFAIASSCHVAFNVKTDNISLTLPHPPSPQIPTGAPTGHPGPKEKGEEHQYVECRLYGTRSGSSGTMILDSGVPPDVQQWVRLVEAGEIYSSLMSFIGWDASRRQEFKDNELFSVIYGDPTNFHWRKSGDRLLPPSVLKPVLADEFPTVYAFLFHQHNEHGLGGLARAMQKAESDLVIRRVCGGMTEQYPEAPLLTIHDSILTWPMWVGKVERFLIEEFARLGIHLALRESPEVGIDAEY